MSRFHLPATGLLICLFSPCVGLAIPPLPIGGSGQNLQRLPDDQIEGTIFEYRGTLKRKPKEGEDVRELQGSFRVEGTAVFAVDSTITLPSPADAKKIVDAVRRGKAPKIKAPQAPQQKRIGQYRKLSRSRRRFDFDDPDSMNGIMIVWLKKGTSDVWMGTFSEKDGKKTVREWDVQVRPIED